MARTNATALTGGTILATGTASQPGGGTTGLDLKASTDHRLGSSIAGVNDIIVLAVQRITGTAESFLGSLNWRETF